MFWKTAVSPIHGLVWCPINTYNSFFQFCSRCRRLLCNYRLIFLTTLFLTLELAQEPDCHPNTWIHTCKLGCLLPRKQSFCCKYILSWVSTTRSITSSITISQSFLIFEYRSRELSWSYSNEFRHYSMACIVRKSWCFMDRCCVHISRRVATVFPFLFNFLWNHVSHAELLMVGPGKLMVGHRP